jgi:DNA primase
MKLGRCPVCHSHLHLDALIQDDAGSELLGVLAGLGRPLARPLVQYLALFRPAKSDLSNARALKLAKETLDIADRDSLIAALQDTVRSIQEKRQKGQVQPLKNHNYLKQVLASVAPEARRPASEADNNRPTVTEKKQGMEESPEEAQRKWEAHMRKLGVDPNQYKVKK